MANTMRTFVRIDNVNEEVKNYFQQFVDTDPESKYFSQSINTLRVLNTLYGTNYTEENSYSSEWGNDNLGSKWMFFEFDSVSDDEIRFIIETAWSVPIQFLETLTRKLTEIGEDVIVSGTYEDEGYEPIGAFCYGKEGYGDIEDLDEFIDIEQMEFDEEYRDEIFDKLEQLREDMVDWYDEFLEEESSSADEEE